jgi:CheY-like chemotaxis protein
MKILKQKIKTPIIALTANAMEGDKERFIKEGFDDYLSKPIVVEELEKILDKYLGIKKKIILKKQENKYVDFNFIKKELPISDDLLFKVFKTFLNSYPNIMQDLKDAIDKKDYEKIYVASHRLKGAAANIRLKSVSEIAEKIERASRENLDVNYKQLFDKLEKVLEKLKKELERIMK